VGERTLDARPLRHWPRGVVCFRALRVLFPCTLPLGEHRRSCALHHEHHLALHEPGYAVVGHMDGRRALSYRGLGAQVAGTDYKRSPASAGPPTTRSSASRAGISYCFSVVGPVARAQCIEGARRFLQTVALVVAAFYVFPVIAVFVFNYFTTVEQVPGAELCQYRSVYL